MNIKTFVAFINILICFQLQAQNCTGNSSADTVPGKYLTAAQYPWLAARAEYFLKLSTTADKTKAREVLAKIETAEQKTHKGFVLTGGNWENYYSTTGYTYYNSTPAATYTFQSALYEFFCNKGSYIRNSEYSTVLRIYVNALPINNLPRFLRYPFGSSFGEYDYGIQYKDWKKHKPADVNAPLISLFSYLSCTSTALTETINTGDTYFQDIADKDIKANNRSQFINRCWVISKKKQPVLLPVSRKEYLQSLLEYYEREKIYFPKLINQLTQDHNKSVSQYSNWEADVAAKAETVQKNLTEKSDEWLSAQAVINQAEESALTYKAGFNEKTNRNRFWSFYDGKKNSEPLYKYNPGYFAITGKNAASPQFITVVFRYVTSPASLRISDNFTRKFDFEFLRKMLE